MSNDLGFLILFIILPTVLIVSGFWMMLIVRSELRLRTAPEASTATEEAGDESIIAVEAENDEDPATPNDGPFELPAHPIDADEEFWTPALEAKPEPLAALPDADAIAGAKLGDTANIPTAWEVELDADAGPNEEVSDDETRRQRQPSARMVPSTEHVRRRTGQDARRTPALGRSVVRDEDSMESPDRG